MLSELAINVQKVTSANILIELPDVLTAAQSKITRLFQDMRMSRFNGYAPRELENLLETGKFTKEQNQLSGNPSPDASLENWDGNNPKTPKKLQDWMWECDKGAEWILGENPQSKIIGNSSRAKSNQKKFENLKFFHHPKQRTVLVCKKHIMGL